MALAINYRSSAVDDMAQHWLLIDALLGGTPAMRKAGKALLPQQPREDDDDYAYRLKVATLFPAFARTVGVMAGKPFSKELILGDDVPEDVAKWTDDIDGEGRSVHAFAADLMHEAIAYGFGGILVDYTRRDDPGSRQADDISMGARPYWVHISHDRILGWKVGSVNGAAGLTQLRIAETAEVDDGEYGTKTINRVRMYTPGAFELWEETSEGAYRLIESGSMAPLKAIPFVPIYGSRTGFMKARPPMLELAHLNAKHWREQSDQDDSARFARKRLLVVSGIDDDTAITAGSSYALSLPPGGDAKVVQGSAESVTVGRSELDAIEAQMLQTGAELLTRQPGSRTATESANDAEANKSELQRIVETFEDSLDQALQFTAEWLGEPDGGTVSLFKDFAAPISNTDSQALIAMQQGGIITKATVIKEQQRRGVLSPDIVAADELAAVGEEGPPLGAMNA